MPRPARRRRTRRSRPTRARSWHARGADPGARPPSSAPHAIRPPRSTIPDSAGTAATPTGHHVAVELWQLRAERQLVGGEHVLDRLARAAERQAAYAGRRQRRQPPERGAHAGAIDFDGRRWRRGTRLDMSDTLSGESVT
jgi:hypothetical protein